jgi:hypothetical protein
MLRPLLLLVAAAAMMLPAAAHSHKTKSLEIVHPWARASAEGATSARVFMTVKSLDGRPDRLIAASTPRAGKVELHGAGKGAGAFSVGRGKDLVLYGEPAADRPHIAAPRLRRLQDDPRVRARGTRGDRRDGRGVGPASQACRRAPRVRCGAAARTGLRMVGSVQPRARLHPAIGGLDGLPSAHDETLSPRKRDAKHASDVMRAMQVPD